MCLTVTQTGDDWRQKNPGVKTVKVYKIITRDANGQYITPYMGSTIIPDEDLIPDEEAPSPLPTNLEGGVIHAFSDKKQAEYAHYSYRKMWWSEITQLIECEVPVEDIVAFGFNGEIALSKLRIPSEVLKCVYS